MKWRHGLIACAVLGVLLATVVVGLALASPDSSERTDAAGLLALSAERLADPSDYKTSEGAIAFAPGVSFEEAFLRLHIAQVSGVPDPGMRAVEALPTGVVALIPSDPAGQVVIDMAAPYGYDAALGAALSPTYALETPPGEGARRSSSGPWLEGSKLVIPSLPSCMVQTSRSAPIKACGVADKAIEDTLVALP